MYAHGDRQKVNHSMWTELLMVQTEKLIATMWTELLMVQMKS